MLSWMTPRQRMRSSRKAVGVYSRWNSAGSEYEERNKGQGTHGVGWLIFLEKHKRKIKNRKKLRNAPDSLWPNNRSLTILFFLLAAFSALMVASMARLTRLASASFSSLACLWEGVSSGGGRRSWSSGSSAAGILDDGRRERAYSRNHHNS